MYNPNQFNQFNQPFNMNNMNNNFNMNQAMMNMNQMTGMPINNMNQAQFIQMINSNPMMLMMWNQMVQNMQNMQNMQNIQNMQNMQGMQNMTPNNMNISQNNRFQINLNFIDTNGNKFIIHTEPDEKMSSVINKYINKSNDFNNNYYLFNGKRIVQSLTVAELGLNDASEIHVANAGNIIGAIL